MQDFSFEDTHLTEPSEREYFDTTEKILELSDQLAEEIVLENIEEQLNNENFDILNEKINYVRLFREKYENIDFETPFYDKEYISDSLEKVTTLVLEGLANKYKVELGTDLDYTEPTEYLKDIETLYEFLFIRQYENIIDYLNFKLKKNKNIYLLKYSEIIQEEKHAKDLFVMQAKKKFKNEEDVIILHFMDEIIQDIEDETNSAYLLFTEITNLDLFEEYNYSMNEMLINYGNKIILNNDLESAKLYLLPLKNKSIRNDIKNELVMKYLEDVDLSE